MQCEEDWLVMHALHAHHGWSISKIAHEFGVNWRTARRYATLGLSPTAALAGPGDLTLTFLHDAPTYTPMANAAVRVYQWPTNPPASFTLTLIASGQANSSGVFTGTFNPSLITGDLGHSDTGQNLFDVIVLAADTPHAWMAIRSGVWPIDASITETFIANVNLGTVAPEAPSWTDAELLGITSATLDDDAVDPDGGDPDEANLIYDPDGHHTDVIIGETTRQVKVLGWNISNGMKGTFIFTSGRQTKTDWALSIGGSQWKIGGMMLEETSRGAGAPLYREQSLHQIRYAKYRFYRYLICGKVCWDMWKPNHWTGGLDRYAAYSPPAFDRAHSELLGDGAFRKTGQIMTFGGSFTIVGLSMTSKAAYGSITEVRWDPIPGCSLTRYLWGNGVDWPVAGIVQAICTS